MEKIHKVSKISIYVIWVQLHDIDYQYGNILDWHKYNCCYITKPMIYIQILLALLINPGPNSHYILHGKLRLFGEVLQLIKECCNLISKMAYDYYLVSNQSQRRQEEIIKKSSVNLHFTILMPHLENFENNLLLTAYLRFKS